MAKEPGPVSIIGQTSPVQIGWGEWSVYLPPNSIYVGKTLRMRGSGWINAPSVVSGLRFGIGSFVTNPPTITLAANALYTHIAMTPRTVGPVPMSTFSFDWTMVCRTVGISTTDWFCHAYFASDVLINYGGTANTQTTGTPIVNPIIAAPGVSTVKHTNVADVWMGPHMANNAQNGTLFIAQLLNYRVDSIA